MLHLIYEGDRKSSSVTLIITEEHNIIVDTSTKDKKDLIISKLKELNFEPKDIDIIINTHIHKGHTENNDLFEDANIYASAHECIKKCDGCMLYSEIDEIYGFEPIEKFPNEEITIIKTPGHTYGSISVLYEDYIIVGDAAPLKENILNNKVPENIVDFRAAKGSIRRIKMLKKNIITGHEGIVYVNEYL
ncbi:MBL fold metallo-hydrolase [Methanocaldococcus indicus]|uniref:MBL fold metallo-hydrolase n=1 Tax=Methanocaldococcus indicus TaxID=213231 RepID=UPI003C6D70EE